MEARNTLPKLPFPINLLILKSCILTPIPEFSLVKRGSCPLGPFYYWSSAELFDIYIAKMPSRRHFLICVLFKTHCLRWEFRVMYKEMYDRFSECGPFSLFFRRIESV